MTSDDLPETRWFTPADLNRGPTSTAPWQVPLSESKQRAIRMWQHLYDLCAQDSDDGLADQIVSGWFRDSCPECHGSGWADEGRPCEHPRW